jgi:hypothetical protein
MKKKRVLSIGFQGKFPQIDSLENYHHFCGSTACLQWQPNISFENSLILITVKLFEPSTQGTVQ